VSLAIAARVGTAPKYLDAQEAIDLQVREGAAATKISSGFRPDPAAKSRRPLHMRPFSTMSRSGYEITTPRENPNLSIASGKTHISEPLRDNVRIRHFTQTAKQKRNGVGYDDIGKDCDHLDRWSLNRP